jgi:hypothetical protein
LLTQPLVCPDHNGPDIIPLNQWRDPMSDYDDYIDGINRLVKENDDLRALIATMYSIVVNDNEPAGDESLKYWLTIGEMKRVLQIVHDQDMRKSFESEMNSITTDNMREHDLWIAFITERGFQNVQYGTMDDQWWLEKFKDYLLDY